MKTYKERMIEVGRAQADIIEEMSAQPDDWHTLPVDTLILVRNNLNKPWQTAYFKMYCPLIPLATRLSTNRTGPRPYYCWSCGRTSQTSSPADSQQWAYAMLAPIPEPYTNELIKAYQQAADKGNQPRHALS